MAHRLKKLATDVVESLPPLPLDADHWQAIFEAMQLSPQQARIVELILRSTGHKQIAAAMGIAEPTLKTYLQRIFARTGTRGPMQLAMHALAVSHEVSGNGKCRPSRRPCSFGDPAMAHRLKKLATDVVESLPPLPLDADHWQAIFEAMQLSPQQARIVELILRSTGHKQIAAAMGIAEPTLKTYLQRIFARTGTRGPMQLAMHALAVSHEVSGNGKCRPNG